MMFNATSELLGDDVSSVAAVIITVVGGADFPRDWHYGETGVVEFAKKSDGAIGVRPAGRAIVRQSKA